jgi:hypothetical protein
LLGQDRELLDLLDAGELLVRLIDGSLTASRVFCSEASSSTDFPSRSFCPAQTGAKSGSRTISATLKGLALPMAATCPTSGLAAFRFDSMLAGDMFLPAALMISSFFRSTIFR